MHPRMNRPIHAFPVMMCHSSSAPTLDQPSARPSNDRFAPACIGSLLPTHVSQPIFSQTPSPDQHQSPLSNRRLVLCACARRRVSCCGVSARPQRSRDLIPSGVWSRCVPVEVGFPVSPACVPGPRSPFQLPTTNGGSGDYEDQPTAQPPPLPTLLPGCPHASGSTLPHPCLLR